MHPRGFGFFTEENTAPPVSSFVIPPELNAFLADDVVEAVITVGDDGRTNASNLKLLERTRTELFGTVVVHRGAAFLKVDREVANTDLPLDGAAVDPPLGAHVVAAVAPGQRARALRVVETADSDDLRWRYADYAELGDGTIYPRTAEAWRGRLSPLGARRFNMRAIGSGRHFREGSFRLGNLL